MREQTFSEHLDELRKRLLWSLASVGVGVLGAFFIREWLLRVIERPHRFAMKSIHLDSNLYVFRYEETFFVQLKIWLIAGFVLSSPAIFFHIWRFIGEALQPKEKKVFWKYFPTSFLLFALGALFGYYFLIPYGLLFLANFGMETGVYPMIHFAHYTTFFFLMTVLTGIIFELPLIMVFATKTGLVSAQTFKQQRKIAIFTIFIAAAIFTPPDPVSQLLMAAPLLVLYELGCWISAFSEKKRLTLQANSAQS